MTVHVVIRHRDTKDSLAKSWLNQLWRAVARRILANEERLSHKRFQFARPFDQDYVTITPEYRLEVSPRLKEDYRNGRSYYPLQGSSVCVPAAAADAPSVDFLRWHNERVYRAV